MVRGPIRGTAQDLDLGFSCPVLPSTELEHRPEGGDKYSRCGSNWKHYLFPTATMRDATGLKEFGGMCRPILAQQAALGKLWFKCCFPSIDGFQSIMLKRGWLLLQECIASFSVTI